MSEENIINNIVSEMNKLGQQGLQIGDVVAMTPKAIMQIGNHDEKLLTAIGFPTIPKLYVTMIVDDKVMVKSNNGTVDMVFDKNDINDELVLMYRDGTGIPHADEMYNDNNR